MIAGYSALDWNIVIPELILLGAAFVVLMLDVFGSVALRRSLPWIALAGVVGGIVAAVLQWDAPYRAFNGMLVNDNFTVLIKFAILTATALAVLVSVDYVRRENLPTGEYYGLLLLSAIGMLLMAASSNLMMIFLSLEVLSISLYVLTGLAKLRPTSQEAGLKYLLLGAFASAFFVYGCAMVYGATGAIDLRAIAASAPGSMLLVGAGMLLVGLGFKVAAVPFQMWTPDVYEGAPSSVTAFMSVGTKVAAFAALIRVFVFALDGISATWIPALWVIAALTMTVGNIVAIAQSSIKRMLAYSSIAHAGFILVGITAANQLGIQSAVYYLIVYAFMNLGAWAVVTAVTRRGEDATGLNDYAGLFWSHPVLASAMALFMFALAGLPPTAGFTAKIFVFVAAYKAGMIGLVIIAILTTIVSAYYYLRVTVLMFMHRPKEPPQVRVPLPAATAIAIAALAVIWLLLFPNSTRAFTEPVTRLMPFRQSMAAPLVVPEVRQQAQVRPQP